MIRSLLIDFYHYFIILSSGLFDRAYYLETYFDVRKADIAPLWHYIKFGWKEGRNPSEWVKAEDIYECFITQPNENQTTFRKALKNHKRLLGITRLGLRKTEAYTKENIKKSKKSVLLKNNYVEKKAVALPNFMELENQNIELLKYTQLKSPIKIIGITRVRNEGIIFEDTLKHISNIVDKIIVFDDDSSDETLDIALSYSQVIAVMKNKVWLNQRINEETRHRQLLLEIAKSYEPLWLFYFDADERFEGINRDDLLFSDELQNVDGIKINLFDAYLTQEDSKPVAKGEELFNRRKYFGRECREILMLWRNLPQIHFEGLDAREPVGCVNVITRYYCQHYGKAISIQEWENTCSYYSTYFPEPYRSKWNNRKGKAIHNKSDFDSMLFQWEDVKDNKIII